MKCRLSLKTSGKFLQLYTEYTNCSVMVLLKIDPLHDDIRDCIEDCIVSVVAWLGREYELAFSECWGFSFASSKKDSTAIGDKIGPGIGSIRHSLKEYLGIELEDIFNKDVYEYLDIACNELSKGYPLIIFTDSYWTPWDKHYHEYHFNHASLLVGIDKVRGEMYSTDPAFGESNLIFPIKDFEAGCLGCVLFNVKNEYRYEWDVIVSNAIRLLQGSDDLKNNSFDAMQTFCSYLSENCFDIAQELHEYTYIWQAPLYRNLCYIDNGRRKFASTLKYLSKKYNIKDLDYISNELILAANIWNKIKCVVLKYYYLNCFNEKKNNIINYIYEVKKKEEDIYYSLKSLVEDNDQKSINRSIDVYYSIGSKNNEISKKDNIIFLDLTDYFNNNAFASYDTNQFLSDFTDTGECYLNDGLPEENIWEVGDMKFKFPAIENGTYNNMCCNQQFIPIDPLPCHNIMILGSSEWGNFLDYITVIYSDEQVQKIPFGFTDWSGNKPVFGEIIAWTGKGIRSEQGKISQIPDPVHIYAYKSNLNCEKKIKGIILPQCSNIHIFAISLEVA